MLSSKSLNSLSFILISAVATVVATVTFQYNTPLFLLGIIGIVGLIIVLFYPTALIYLFWVSFFIGGMLYSVERFAVNANDLICNLIAVGALGEALARGTIFKTSKLYKNSEWHLIVWLYVSLMVVAMLSFIVNLAAYPSHMVLTALSYLYRYFYILVAFWLIPQFNISPSLIRKMLITYILGALTQFPIAFYQSAILKLDADLVYGTGMQHHGFLGLTSLLGIGFGIYLILSSKHLIERVFLVGATLILFYTHFLSEARSALLGLLAAIALSVVVRIRLTIRSVTMVIGVALFLFVAYLFTPMGTAIDRSFQGGGYGSTGVDVSSASRIIIWLETIKGIKRAPIAQKLVGYGFGGYQQIKYETVLWAGAKSATGAHNNLLHAFAETGLIGFIIFIAIFIVTLHYLWKRRENLYAHVLFYTTVALLVSGLSQETFWVQSAYNNFWLMYVVLLGFVPIMEADRIPKKPLHMN
jgi:O-antigen ligase